MTHYSPMARLLHWLMAAMLLSMLFIGVTLVSSLTTLHAQLLAIHRPLGIAILLLALLRLGNRLRRPPPALPASLPLWQQLLARACQWLFYALMIGLPLIGWAMLSAGNYPVVLLGAVHLPPLLSPNPLLYAGLRAAHGYLAYLLFALFLLHLSGALLHGLVRRDGVFSSMARSPRSAP